MASHLIARRQGTIFLESQWPRIMGNFQLMMATLGYSGLLFTTGWLFRWFSNACEEAVQNCRRGRTTSLLWVVIESGWCVWPTQTVASLPRGSKHPNTSGTLSLSHNKTSLYRSAESCLCWYLDRSLCLALNLF